MAYSKTLSVTIILFALVAITNATALPNSNTMRQVNISILDDNSLFKTPGISTLVYKLQEKIKAQGRCNPNVCFALDGSGSISEDEYRTQKEFVQLISAVIGVDEDSAFAGVQYGLRAIGISRLTNDVDAFLLRVEGSVHKRARRTFISSGLAFCIQELRRRAEDANKIVLLGDGRSTFGGNPVPIAKKFLPPAGNGSIAAIGVKFADTSRLEAITGDPDKVLAIDEYFELLDLIEDLVADICL